MEALYDGGLLLAFNNASQAGQRTPLSLAVSNDNGQVWDEAPILEDDPAGSFSYPTLLCPQHAEHCYAIYTVNVRPPGKLQAASAFASANWASNSSRNADLHNCHASEQQHQLLQREQVEPYPMLMDAELIGHGMTNAEPGACSPQTHQQALQASRKAQAGSDKSQPATSAWMPQDVLAREDSIQGARGERARFDQKRTHDLPDLSLSASRAQIAPAPRDATNELPCRSSVSACKGMSLCGLGPCSRLLSCCSGKLLGSAWLSKAAKAALTPWKPGRPLARNNEQRTLEDYGAWGWTTLGMKVAMFSKHFDTPDHSS